MNKKTIGPVVAIALLLVVSVSAAVMFQNWYQTFQSNMYSDIESANINPVEVNNLDGDLVYIKNSNPKDINFTNIKIDDKSCSINGTILAKTITKINLNNCTANMNIGPKTVTIITNSGVFSRTLMLRSVTYTPNPTTPSSGSFSGYAWGEQFGYISFNGTGYQVNMTNNQLYGFAYSENLGYISFNGTNYGVINSNGTLNGYAYGENIGYINFNNSPLYSVTFNGTNLNGHAYSENYGYIHFNYNNIYDIIYN